MMIEMQLWELITLLLTFFGCVGGFGKVLLDQFEKRQGEHFAAQEESRAQAQKHWDERFNMIEGQRRRETEGWSALEREFLRFQAEMPVNYVRREDYVRGQSVIEAKLDALYNKLEVVQMKGGHHA